MLTISSDGNISGYPSGYIKFRDNLAANRIIQIVRPHRPVRVRVGSLSLSVSLDSSGSTIIEISFSETPSLILEFQRYP